MRKLLRERSSGAEGKSGRRVRHNHPQTERVDVVFECIRDDEEEERRESKSWAPADEAAAALQCRRRHAARRRQEVRLCSCQPLRSLCASAPPARQTRRFEEQEHRCQARGRVCGGGGAPPDPDSPEPVQEAAHPRRATAGCAGAATTGGHADAGAQTTFPGFGAPIPTCY